MTWIFNEDAAIKYALQGIIVHDRNDKCPLVDGVKQHSDTYGRSVTVKYHNPDDEISKYSPPTIVLEFPEISLAYDRMHEGSYTKLPYAPEGMDTWWADDATEYDPSQSPYRTPEFPVAYNIDYRIQVYTRDKRTHLIPILQAMEQRLGRFAYLSIPQDGTFRRVTRMSGPHTEWIVHDDTTNAKAYETTYMVRVPTEIVPFIPEIPLATQILLHEGYVSLANFDPAFNMDSYYTEKGLDFAELKQAHGIFGSRRNVNWNTLSKQ